MKTDQFLKHYGIVGNPFSEEDAQTEERSTKQHTVCAASARLGGGIREGAAPRTRNGFATSLVRVSIPPITEERRSAPHSAPRAPQVYRPEGSRRFPSAVFDEQRILWGHTPPSQAAEECPLLANERSVRSGPPACCEG